MKIYYLCLASGKKGTSRADRQRVIYTDYSDETSVICEFLSTIHVINFEVYICIHVYINRQDV